ncbi:hypothetical protein NDU88_001979 [Pleurodeles waltl]|uniref:Uncharacterized protein n=1 Tax=Pleurodeles waltl TaxID=8319 RepID=A0AAV7Q5V0_PLEWA|nr:hypothetical protein NDU88_001979 [Pleurodeles waltl]
MRTLPKALKTKRAYRRNVMHALQLVAIVMIGTPHFVGFTSTFILEEILPKEYNDKARLFHLPLSPNSCLLNAWFTYLGSQSRTQERSR